MKTLKITLLMAIISIASSINAQNVSLNITDTTAYLGLYEAKLYVIDTYTQNVCLVGEEKNLQEGSSPISPINLICVNIVSDQVDRYRYIAYVLRQSAPGSGQGWTPLLDTSEMWGTFIIDVMVN